MVDFRRFYPNSCSVEGASLRGIWERLRRLTDVSPSSSFHPLRFLVASHRVLVAGLLPNSMHGCFMRVKVPHSHWASQCNLRDPGWCENTRAAWQLFFTARTWAKPHRFDSSVTLLLRRVVQSKTQWHSNVLKLLKLLQKSSQASKTFFQLLQIKRLQLKLTNNLQNSYQISSQHQVPKTWVKQHPKTPKTQKQTKIHLQALPCTNWFHLVPNWFLPGSYRFLWVL